MKRIIRIWLPVIIWAGIIFYSSSFGNPFTSPVASAVQTDVNSVDIPEVSIRPVLPNHGYLNITSIIVSNELFRRGLHIAIYLILGFFVYRAFSLQPVRLIFASTIITSMTFALSDEIHQIFVPGRSFQLLDLVADLVGVLIGVVLFKFGNHIYYKYQENFVKMKNERLQ
jgi:VanZ family protein